MLSNQLNQYVTCVLTLASGARAAHGRVQAQKAPTLLVWHSRGRSRQAEEFSPIAPRQSMRGQELVNLLEFVCAIQVTDPRVCLDKYLANFRRRQIHRLPYVLLKNLTPTQLCEIKGLRLHTVHTRAHTAP